MKQGDVEQYERSIPESTGYGDETGFMENAAAGFAVFHDEDTSISRFFNTEMYDERNQEIDALISSGMVDPTDYTTLGGYDYTRMSYDLKHRGHDILDDYDVRNNVRESLARQRAEAEDIHSRANGFGVAGMFMGQMAAAQLDPVNLGSMLIPGVGMIRQGTIMARVGKSALYYGATGAAAETIIQPIVADWKNEIDVDYGAMDMLTNIALAGVAEGTLGTALEITPVLVKRGFAKTRENIRKSEPKQTADALIKEIDQAEAEYDWHVRAFKRNEVLSRVERLKELQRMQYEGYIDQKKTIDDLIDDYNKEEFQSWMAEDDWDAHELVEGPDDVFEEFIGKSAGFFEDSAANQDLHIGVVKAMDAVTRLEEEKFLDQTTEEMWADLDNDDFMNMSQAERDAFVQRALGESDIEEEVIWETGQLDSDGEMMYENRSPEDIRAELEEGRSGVEAFMTCWTGGDVET